MAAHIHDSPLRANRIAFSFPLLKCLCAILSYMAPASISNLYLAFSVCETLQRFLGRLILHHLRRTDDRKPLRILLACWEVPYVSADLEIVDFQAYPGFMLELSPRTEELIYNKINFEMAFMTKHVVNSHLTFVDHVRRVPRMWKQLLSIFWGARFIVFLAQLSV